MRSALAHAGKNGRRVVSAYMATAFAQNTPEAARQQWRQMADQLRPKLPKLSALMDEAETDVLAYMSFPAPHRTKLHSTNPLERLNLLCAASAWSRPVDAGAVRVDLGWYRKLSA